MLGGGLTHTSSMRKYGTDERHRLGVCLARTVANLVGLSHCVVLV